MAVKKKKTQKYWKVKIDKVYHEYIRRRDADNDTGYCTCVSCKKIIHFTESDGGHFISRKHLSTRYDEENVNAQCRKCNRFEDGRQFEYSLTLGEEVANKLLIKSKQILKLDDTDWLEIFETYRDKLAELKDIQDF